MMIINLFLFYEHSFFFVIVADATEHDRCYIEPHASHSMCSFSRQVASEQITLKTRKKKTHEIHRERHKNKIMDKSIQVVRQTKCLLRKMFEKKKQEPENFD